MLKILRPAVFLLRKNPPYPSFVRSDSSKREGERLCEHGVQSCCTVFYGFINIAHTARKNTVITCAIDRKMLDNIKKHVILIMVRALNC